LDEYSEAEQLAQKIVTKDSTNIEMWILLADIPYAQKDYETAESRYHNAISKISPDDLEWRPMEGVIKKKLSTIARIHEGEAEPVNLAEIPLSDFIECDICGQKIPKVSSLKCGNCSNVLCENDVVKCKTCGKILCKDYNLEIDNPCSVQCSKCGEIFCQDDVQICQLCYDPYCKDCAVTELLMSPRGIYCRSCTAKPDFQKQIK
jgi:tetratricopeptide (TPR) repeat protein